MRDIEIRAMIRALRKIEADQYLSLKGLAHKLGLSAGYLSMIFSGKRQPGMRFVRAVIEHFPEIRQMMAESLKLPTEPDDGSCRNEPCSSPTRFDSEQSHHE